MPWKVFAEDSGTGLNDQANSDYGDGAHFGALVHSSNIGDYAPVAPTITEDFTTPSATLSESQYRVTAYDVTERDHDGDGAKISWPETTFIVYAPETTLTLVDNSINHIYIDLSLSGSPDEASYYVDTTDTTPSLPYLKVGEVDTTNNTSKVVCDNPKARFREAYEGTNRLATRNWISTTPTSHPSYASKSDVPNLDAGDVVYISNDGLYVETN